MSTIIDVQYKSKCTNLYIHIYYKVCAYLDETPTKINDQHYTELIIKISDTTFSFLFTSIYSLFSVVKDLDQNFKNRNHFFAGLGLGIRSSVF